MNAQERIAIALFHDWQKSDKELNISWSEAAPTLQRVFLRKAEVAIEALAVPMEHLVSFLHTADALGIATKDKPLSVHLENYLTDRGLTA